MTSDRGPWPSTAAQTVRRLQSEVRLLERRLEKYARLADRLASAEFFDFTVYEQVPGPEWVAIHRADLRAIVTAAECAAFDRLQSPPSRPHGPTP